MAIDRSGRGNERSSAALINSRRRFSHSRSVLMTRVWGTIPLNLTAIPVSCLNKLFTIMLLFKVAASASQVSKVRVEDFLSEQGVYLTFSKNCYYCFLL